MSLKEEIQFGNNQRNEHHFSFYCVEYYGPVILFQCSPHIFLIYILLETILMSVVTQIIITN